MKHLIYILIACTLLVGCSENEIFEKETEKTVIVSAIYGEGKEIASPCISLLYEKSVADSFDYQRSFSYMYDYWEMRLNDGTHFRPENWSKTDTITNVENGNYTLIVYFKPPKDANDGFGCYYGRKQISISEKDHSIIKIPVIFTETFKWIDL